MEPWKTLSSEYLFQEKWLTVRSDRCMTADGIVIDPYYIIERPDWVQVAAFDAEDRILVVRQYRHGEGRSSVELPGGIIEQNETPLEAARRELLEETGCVADRFEHLASLSPNPAEQNNTMHCFVASGARISHTPDMDETENIESEFIEVHELLRLIDQGRFFHALHVTAVLLALRQRRIQAWLPEKKED